MNVASGEYPDLAITALHPGLVETDLARESIEKSGWPAITVEESVAGLLKLLEKPKEEVTGKFLNEQGEQIPW